MAKALPPLNVRRVAIRVCANCAFFAHADGTATCHRPDGPDWDSGEAEEYFHTCTRWAETTRHEIIPGVRLEHA